MKSIFITYIVFSTLFLSSAWSKTTDSSSISADDREAYKSALENYRAIYKEQIQKLSSDPYRGFNSIYEIGENEDSVFSNSTEQDIKLYAQLCALVYTSERSDFDAIQDEIKGKLRNLDLGGHELVGILKRNLATKPALSAILLYNKDKNHLILAFKGTVDADNYDDWARNVNFTAYKGPDPLGALRAPDGSKMNVHGGFARAYLEGIDDFMPQFREIMAQYAPSIIENIETKKMPLKIDVTGHSLGGALSSLAANDMRRIVRTTNIVKNPAMLKVGNISFASPRVWDKASADKFNEGMGGEHETLRFVDIADLVPDVPPLSKHVGIPFYFGAHQYTYSIARHSMADNYLIHAPATFTKIQEDAKYFRFLKDSIKHYKKLLGDTSSENFEVYDQINNLKIQLRQLDSSIAFFRGKIDEENDIAKVQAVVDYWSALKVQKRKVEQQIADEEKKLKKGSSWWPF
jgi:hypothetical protein